MNTKTPILNEIIEKLKQRNIDIAIAKSQTAEEILVEMNSKVN